MSNKAHRAIVSRATRLGVALFSLFALSTVAAQQPDDKRVNTVRSIRAVGAEVEIELHSTVEFPVRDEVVILRIGNRDITKSRPPADGSLNTLIFSLAAADFDRLPDAAPMTVRYGKALPSPGPAPQAADPARWNFGQLNKGRLVR
jgi:hypothetical protein